jgi:hypothetical protein
MKNLEKTATAEGRWLPAVAVVVPVWGRVRR